MTLQEIAVKHGLVIIPSGSKQISERMLMTIISNFYTLGYTLSEESVDTLKKLSLGALDNWYQETVKTLKKVSGEDKREIVETNIVYRNFPEEVLKMSDAEYWTRQMFIYWAGIYSGEEEKPRPELFEDFEPTLLHLATEEKLFSIYNSLIQSMRGLNDTEKEIILTFLTSEYAEKLLNQDLDVNFKEQLIYLAEIVQSAYPEYLDKIPFKTATDVLRFAVGLSGGDISLSQKTKFKSFPRKTRRQLLTLLENCGNIEEDIARHKNVWKRLFHSLHVGEYSSRFSKSYNVAQKIRNNVPLETFNSQLESFIGKKKVSKVDVLAAILLLTKRPGEFARRLDYLLRLNQQTTKAVLDSFSTVVDKVSTPVLLSLSRFFLQRNYQTIRFFRPKGSWKRAKVLEDTRNNISKTVILELNQIIREELQTRIDPELDFLGLNVDPDLNEVKIPSSVRGGIDTKYTLGSSFRFPKNTTFLRSVSYWKSSFGDWADTSFAFFNKDWKHEGDCCWNRSTLTVKGEKAGIYGGDPINTDTNDGVATEIIDIYIDKLIADGIRYGVWALLSYRGHTFSEYNELFAYMMFREKPEEGKIFEPKMAEMGFPLSGEEKGKNIAIIDFVDRKVYYFDCNVLPQTASISTQKNIQALEESMPAIMEYIHQIPSISDVFDLYNQNEAGISCLFSDKDLSLDTGETAYVFNPVNPKNKFKSLRIGDFITGLE